jgi:hypothetical protein
MFGSICFQVNAFPSHAVGNNVFLRSQSNSVGSCGWKDSQDTAAVRSDDPTEGWSGHSPKLACYKE